MSQRCPLSVMNLVMKLVMNLYMKYNPDILYKLRAPGIYKFSRIKYNVKIIIGSERAKCFS